MYLKRIISLLLCLSVIFAVLPVFAAETSEENPYFFKADFENGSETDGGLALLKGATEITEIDAEHGKSLALNTSVSSSVGVAARFETTKQPIVVGFSYLAEKNSLLLLSIGSYGLEKSEEFLTNTGNIWHTFYSVGERASRYSGMRGWSRSSLEEDWVDTPDGEWHDVLVYFDMPHGNLHYYVDGKLLKADFMNAQCDGISGAALISYPNKYPTYIDNFYVREITKADTLGIPRESIPEDLYNYYGRALDVSFDSGELGNVFSSEKTPAFKCTVTDRENTAGDYEAVFTAKDEYDRIIWQKKESFNIPAGGSIQKRLNLNSDHPYGIFWLYVDITSENHNGYSGYTQYSKVNNPPPDVKNDTLGFCNHYVYNGENFNKNMPLLNLSGAGWVRDGGPFLHEYKDGKLIISEHYMKWYKYLAENDIGLVYHLSYGNIPEYNVGWGTDKYCEGMEMYACAFAKALKKIGVKTVIETYNEWNLYLGRDPRMTTENCAKSWQALYRGVKKGNPEALVVGGDTAGSPLAEYEKIFKIFNGEKFMDALSIHVYPGKSEGSEEGSWMGYYNTTRDLLDKYGYDDVELWITETGWSTMTGMATEKQAAQRIARMAAQLDAGAGCDKVFWYDFQCDGVSRTEREHNFGIVENYTPGYEHPVPLAARGAYVSYTNYNKLTAGCRYAEKLDIGQSNYCYRYAGENGKGLIFAAANLKAKQAGFKLGCESVTVYDMYGNAKTLYPVNGVFTVNIGKDPVYIEGDFEAAEVCEPVFTVDNTELNIPAGAKTKVTVNAGYNTNAAVSSNAGGGVYTDGPIEFNNKSCAVTLKSKPEASGGYAGTDVLGLAVTDSGKNVFYADCDVTYTPSVSLKSMSMVNDSPLFNIWSGKFTFVNEQSDLPVSGQLAVSEPKEVAGLFEPGYLKQLEPHQTADIFLRVPAEMLNKQVKLELKLENGEIIDVKTKLSTDSAHYASVKPEIDGVINEGEWNISSPITVKSEDGGYGFKCGMMYDEEKFYFCAKVDDQRFMQQQVDPSSMWNQDCFQIALCSKSSSTTFTELGIALMPELGPVCYNWTLETGFDSKFGKQGSLIESAEIGIQRIGEQTVYEVAIPWQDIVSDPAEMFANGSFKFDVLLNNDDASSRMMLAYCDCIGSVKNVENMTRVQLLK